MHCKLKKVLNSAPCIRGATEENPRCPSIYLPPGILCWVKALVEKLSSSCQMASLALTKVVSCGVEDVTFPVLDLPTVSLASIHPASWKEREGLTFCKQTPPWPSLISRLSVSHPNLISFNSTLESGLLNPAAVLPTSPGVTLEQCQHLSLYSPAWPCRHLMGLLPLCRRRRTKEAEEGKIRAFWGK